MNLERKGEPDKHGIVVLQWHCGIPPSLLIPPIKQAFPYMYVYEHAWVFIPWSYCISCAYRKSKKKFTQKNKYQENLKTS